MSTGPSPYLLDTRGMKCPRPIIELARFAKDAEDGAEVQVLSDDPAAPGDIEAWCRMRGHQFLEHGQVPVRTTSRLRVRRTPAGAAAATPSPAGPGTPAG